MLKTMQKLQLTSGSRIAVIGAGPAGSLFAFFARKIAKERRLELQVTIYDGKDFLRTGPPGCNLCAGVISECMVIALRREGIVLPEHVIRQHIRGYYHIHLGGCSFIDPPRTSCSIYTVFRGNGPRSSHFDENISFDDHLLRVAIANGAKLVRAAVTDLHLPKQEGERAKIYFTQNNKQCEHEADLIVGAFGLNTNMLNKVEKLGFGYHAPKGLTTLHAEFPLPIAGLKKHLRDRIGVFSLKQLADLRFGVITPKRDFLTVSLIGRGTLRNEALTRFLHHSQVRCIFHDNAAAFTSVCQCRAKIPVGPSKKPFTNRMVIIGDASFSRHFKNGIYSALLTAKLAAEAALTCGITEESFRKNFYQHAKKEIVRDNYIGRFLFFVSYFMARNKVLLSFYAKAVGEGSQSILGRILQLFAWNMMTGEVSYRKVLRDLLLAKFRSMPSIDERGRISQTNERGNGRAKTGASVSKSNDRPSRIKSGDLVAIIGGGPGGVGCAIALKNIARQRGIEIRVRLYEAKASDGIPRYNQCVGVLSPPIKDILAQLDIPFPDHLLQRTITGYILHSDRQSIDLNGDSEPSLAVRRITFDNYLLQQARQRGVEVIESRVTGVEFHDEEVALFSESDNIRAAVVVGAFGLDDGSALMFARESRYRQPQFLNSIVTKWHPGLDFMNQFENKIHAFLPSNPEIEFGALTPKQNHLTINIAGANVDVKIMDQFLSYSPLLQLLPPRFAQEKAALSYFKGKFPISVAKGMFGHRYVTVGDAAGLVRPFKGKGINSALLSGMYAAQVIMQEGVSKTAFQQYRKLNNEVLSDLPYGKAVRIAARLCCNTGLLDHILQLSTTEETLRTALFNSVSAHKPYRVIAHETLTKQFLLRELKLLGRNMLNEKSQHPTI